MPNWKVKDILDHIQDLVGEPVGSFYNISTRLKQLNQAQRELVQDTRALSRDAQIILQQGVSEYWLPEDFLTFGKEAPYFVDPLLSQKLEVTDANWMDETHPNWRDPNLASNSLPMYLVATQGQQFTVYPTPNRPGVIVLPYVIDPDELEDLDDEVFNGHVMMNRYAPALAYKIASIYMMPRVPQLGQQYLAMYNRELREMRHNLRSSPQKKSGLRLKGYKRKVSHYGGNE
jgi:hypothetical protein